MSQNALPTGAGNGDCPGGFTLHLPQLSALVLESAQFLPLSEQLLLQSAQLLLQLAQLLLHFAISSAQPGLPPLLEFEHPLQPSQLLHELQFEPVDGRGMYPSRKHVSSAFMQSVLVTNASASSPVDTDEHCGAPYSMHCRRSSILISARTQRAVGCEAS